MIGQRGQYLAKLSLVEQNRELIHNITSKIKKVTPYLLAIISLVIIFTTIQGNKLYHLAIIIVKDQPKHLSEVSCLLGNGPKLRLNEDGMQKLLTLDETIELLSS